jgi:hypothetical protein
MTSARGTLFQKSYPDELLNVRGQLFENINAAFIAWVIIPAR